MRNALCAGWEYNEIKDNIFLNILHLNKTDRLSEINFLFKKQFVLDIFLKFRCHFIWWQTLKWWCIIQSQSYHQNEKNVKIHKQKKRKNLFTFKNRKIKLLLWGLMRSNLLLFDIDLLHVEPLCKYIRYRYVSTVIDESLLTFFYWLVFFTLCG